MPSKSKGANVNIGLKDNSEEICFESKFVAYKFNTFFCNIAKKLVEKLPARKFSEDKVTELTKKETLKWIVSTSLLFQKMK